MKTPWNIILAIVVFAICIGNLVYLIKVYTKEKELKQHKPCEYQFVVIDDSITIYDGNRTVGTVLLEGDLDGLIIMDNQ